MRIASFAVAISLSVVIGSWVQAQNLGEFSGPLDSIRIDPIREISSPPAPRQSRSITPRPEPVNPASLQSVQLSSRAVASAGVLSDQSQTLSAQQIDGQLQPPPASEPQENSPLAFHSRPPETNPQRAIIDAYRYKFAAESLDGSAFGFDQSRLYNPLEGPQLQLLGTPTVATNFGVSDSCDEWEGFCGCRDLDLSCDCGGLKAKPGHLGLPWLGSGDNCDQTNPFGLQRKRSATTCDCQQCSSD